MQIADILRRAARFTTNNSPVILTGIAVAGTLVTAYFSHQAGVKTTQTLSEEAPDLEPKEKAKLVWKHYVPPVLMAGVTIGAIVSAHKIGANRAAAVTAAYIMSAKAWEEAEEKFSEKLGPKKTREVREEIAQARVDRTPFPSGQTIVTGGIGSWVMDAYTRRYFRSDYESLRAAQNSLNEQILHDDTASLSDFYDLLGLERTQGSDDVGWNTDNTLRLDLDNAEVIIEPSTGAKVPCIVMAYKVMPIREYRTNFRPA